MRERQGEREREREGEGEREEKRESEREREGGQVLPFHSCCLDYVISQAFCADEMFATPLC